MITLKANGSNIELKCPTRASEITADELKRLTENFKVSKDFAIVALISRVKISELIFAANAGKFKQDAKIGITSVMAKVSDKNPDCDIKVGDILTIDNSVIERGHHLGINTGASINVITAVLNKDADLRDNLRVGTLTDDKGIVPTELFVLGFKVVPIMTIVSSISPIAILDDPYKNVIIGA